MARPIIALLTDFGTRDHYSGVMKGVVLGICPDVTLVDISHDLPAHDIPVRRAGAGRRPTSTFPPGTIFLVVVDPGVGTQRRGLAVEAGEWKFVAPDNGVLTAVLRGDAAQARRRAHRAAICAADGEPDVRRPRSLRAGGGVDRQGHSAAGARPRRLRLHAAGAAAADARRRRAARARRPRRSFRQRGDESRSQVVRAAGRWAGRRCS